MAHVTLTPELARRFEAGFDPKAVGAAELLALLDYAHATASRPAA